MGIEAVAVAAPEVAVVAGVAAAADPAVVGVVAAIAEAEAEVEVVGAVADPPRNSQLRPRRAALPTRTKPPVRKSELQRPRRRTTARGPGNVDDWGRTVPQPNEKGVPPKVWHAFCPLFQNFGYIFTAATNSFTCCTEMPKASFSLASSSTSMIFSTPFVPTMAGTPTKNPPIPYSLSQ